MELMNAVALKPAREVTTKYGQRFVVDARLETGEEAAIWAPTDMPAVGSIGQGQTFLVGRHKSRKLNFIDAPTAPPPAAPVHRPIGFQATPIPAAVPNLGKAALEIPSEAKAAIAADAELFAKVYAHCYQQARAVMPQDAPAEAVQACASSTWIALSRRHGLG
ncbi:hypothetical protein DOP62_14350 (plasmid) [Synechococcus elongatus PCC 11801]|uniref:Uncharacterized protein n=2 Tax=Synechococcus elongatus PCC 11801 TaxID=2219813 RepID=A0ACD5A3B4_SYNEL